MPEITEPATAHHSRAKREQLPTSGSHASGPTVLGQPAAGTARYEQRYRRRPALIGLGVALLAVCGGGAAYLAQISGDTIAVLAVADDVWRGEIIDRSDLVTAQAAADPAVDPVPANELADVVGQRVAADLSAGELLTSAAVTAADVPATGQTVVGVAVGQAQVPNEPLNPGDTIRVFDTPNPGDAPPATSPASITATVLSVSDMTETGQLIVDVVVDADVAGTLAAKAATGRVAIVLDSSATEPVAVR